MDATQSLAAFAVTRLGAAGVSRAQARSSRYSAPTRGLRVPVDYPADLRASCAALQVILPPGATFARLTAAELYGLPLPLSIQVGLPEVAFPPGQRRSERLAIKAIQWAEDPLGSRWMGEVLVLHPARVWLDLAAMLEPQDLIAVGDFLLSSGLATVEDLVIVTKWARRRRGVLAARAWLPFLDARSESPQESRTRYWFHVHGLPTPSINLDIRDNHGTWIARVDFAFENAKLVIEYDGAVHLTEVQRRRDAERRNRLQEAGWDVMVITADHLRHPELLCRRIARKLAARTP